MSDQYWIKPADTDLIWEDVNFFINEFSGGLGRSFFERSSASLPDISVRTPDASSNGWLKKKWMIIGGKRYLAKAGLGTILQEPYNEVAASRIMDLLGMEHVGYHIITEKNRPLSLCENFITTDTEFVPAAFVCNVLPKEKDDMYFTHLQKCAAYLHIPGVQEYIDNLLTIDFLIENTDRHYGNFGFIRDVNTLEFIGSAPIFDNGTSLWCQVPDTEIGQWQYCRPFMLTQKQQIDFVHGFHIDTKQLEKCETVTREVLEQSLFLSKERVDKVSRYVGNRARVLSNHINARRK